MVFGSLQLGTGDGGNCGFWFLQLELEAKGEKEEGCFFTFVPFLSVLWACSLKLFTPAHGG
jgi:hypothetical protein